jgi:peptide deformylase
MPRAQTSPLQIVFYPDPVLLRAAVPVARVTPELAGFIAKMRETMYNDHGVGLAAPQVGIGLRIIVVDTDDNFLALINPEIVSRDGSQTGPEGCLSLPDLHADVTRADVITVRGLTPQGKKITLTADGFLARALQHEIDHLDGILFIDRAEQNSFRWITGEKDANGDYIERPTTREAALRVFTQDAALRA